MTATLARPRHDQAADDNDTDQARERFDAARGLDIAASVGLLGYSIAVAVGFSRVFLGGEYLHDLVLIALVGHGVSYLLRLLRAPSIVAIPLLLIVLTWVVAWIYYPHTFSGPFPLADTWNTVRADFRVIQDQFQSAAAPVTYGAGWAFLAGATTAATVWLADTFAFRAQARGESLVPGAVLFVFIAALGVDEHRVSCSLLVIGAGFVALALLRLRISRPPRTVLGRDRHPLVRTLAPLAGATAVVIGGAWAIAPHLPGAHADPWFDTRNDRGGVTEIISPLVDIRQRLVNQANTELLTVAADQPSYWRASALPRFDGETWDLTASILEDTDGALGQAVAGSVGNHQIITITGLRGALVPAAPDPVSAHGLNGYNAISASLVKTDSELADGDVFAVVSAMPRFNADALRAAESSSPPDAIFLDLPDDLPSVIAETAASVTASGATNLDKMVLLQDWFRTTFTYDTNVPNGPGTSAIVSFLTNRVGYCEQFSGTFAAMARTLGLPSRVAVGFTQGEQQADGTYSVLGRNAHAWPEIWFDGYGWVPFEPTPGRGRPGAESYTGVPPQQDTGDTTPPTTTTTTTTTTVAGQAQSAEVAPPPPAQQTPPPTPPQDDAARHSSFPILALLVALVVLACALAMPELVRRWRRRQHGHTTDPAHMLLELWDRAIQALSAKGFRADPTLTPLEQSTRAAVAFPTVAVPMHDLAEVATTATYASGREVSRLAEDSRHYDDGPHDWCAFIEDAVEETLSLPTRVKRYFTIWR